MEIENLKETFLETLNDLNLSKEIKNYWVMRWNCLLIDVKLAKLKCMRYLRKQNKKIGAGGKNDMNKN